jgi:hypothetical protein
MIAALILLTALVLTASVSTLISVARDGYRRVPNAPLARIAR